jgi:competence protein ComEC
MLPVAAAAWVAAGLLTVLPAIAPTAMLSGIGIAALAAVAAVRRGRGRRRWWICLAVTAGFAAAVAGHVALAESARAALVEAADGRWVTATVTVTGRLDPAASGDIWFDARTESVESDVGTDTGAEHGGVAVRIGVSAVDAADLDGVDLGAIVQVRGVAVRPDAGARAALLLRAEQVEVRALPSGVWAALADLRRGLVRSAAQLPDPGGALVPGLAVGDTSAVPPAVDEAMRAASLSHLTAVSGANCAIVVGLAFGAAALCGASRTGRIASGLVALTLFVLLVTPEPSVVRAAAMAAIAMCAVGLGRPAAGLAVLSAAVAVVLVLDPWIATSLGFALSAAATAALLLLARPLAYGLERYLPRTVALAIAVPLAAQLACGPLLVLLDPTVPLLGVLANLLAGPAAPLATIAGFFACLAAPAPLLQSGLIGIAWVPAAWIAEVARVTAAIPGQRLPWLAGPPGAALLAGVGALTALVIASRVTSRRSRLLRVAAAATLAPVVGVIGAHVALGGVVSSWTTPGSWQVVACDIGQGDAILLRSQDAVMLVDTGPEPAVLSRCLSRFGVDTVDTLVLTHFDLDHSGGVAALIGRVGAVLHGPLDRDGARDVARLAQAGAAVHAVAVGARGRLGDASWRVLWPPASEKSPGNAASVAVEVSGERMPAVLLLGDLDAEAQTRMIAALPPRTYDVVKVAHHGSADQSAGLYERIAARLALVSVGVDNDYGHPRPSLLTLLRRTGSRIARTDTDGDVALWLERDGLHLWREHVGAAD